MAHRPGAFYIDLLDACAFRGHRVETLRYSLERDPGYDALESIWRLGGRPALFAIAGERARNLVAFVARKPRLLRR